jgi:phosphate transport system substrate-binding protein
MRKIDLSKIMGYIVSLVLAALGVSILTGLVPMRQDPGSRYRIILGAICILMAAYRVALLRMKTRRGDGNRSGWMFALLLLVGLAGCAKKKTPEETPTRGTLRMAVSESHANLMRAEAKQFMKLYPDAHIDVVPVQTREAFVHLLNDSILAVVTDRPFNTEEEKVASQSKTRYDSVLIARDAMAVVVNLFNNLETISRGQLASILNGALTDWSRLPGSGLSGPIQLVLTGVNSGAYELASGFFTSGKPIIPNTRAESQNEIIRTVAARLQAAGLVSLACLKDTSEFRIEKEKVRALDFAGVDSTGQRTRLRLHQANVYLGKYPLYFPVYMYVNSAKALLAVGFSGFVASTPGQQIVLNWGLVPATMPVRLIQLTSGSPE